MPSPLGLSARSVVGWEAIVGSNSRALQPSRPAGTSPPSRDSTVLLWKAPGFSIDSTRRVVLSGPAQEVGRVRKGTGSASLGQPSTISPSGSAGGQSRSESWASSIGAPQRRASTDTIPTRVGTVTSLTVAPKSEAPRSEASCRLLLLSIESPSVTGEPGLGLRL